MESAHLGPSEVDERRMCGLRCVGSEWFHQHPQRVARGETRVPRVYVAMQYVVRMHPMCQYDLQAHVS